MFTNTVDALQVPKDEDFEKELREKERQKKLEDEGNINYLISVFLK